MNKLLLLLMLFVSIATFSQDVYMSDYSSIYHIEGCKKIKKSYYKTSLKSVLKLGFKACELCNPPTENVVDENTGNNGKELYFSDIVKVDSNLSKNELFSRARIFFSSSFNSSKAVLDVQDKETGELIGNGILKTNGNAGYSYPYGYVKFNIKILLKDGKYKYELSNFNHFADEQNYVSYGLLTNDDECPYKIKCFMCGKNLNNQNWKSIVEDVVSKIEILKKSLKEIMDKPVSSNDGW